jgi:hypothetical protein
MTSKNSLPRRYSGRRSVSHIAFAARAASTLGFSGSLPSPAHVAGGGRPLREYGEVRSQLARSRRHRNPNRISSAPPVGATLNLQTPLSAVHVCWWYGLWRQFSQANASFPTSPLGANFRIPDNPGTNRRHPLQKHQITRPSYEKGGLSDRTIGQGISAVAGIRPVRLAGVYWE